MKARVIVSTRIEYRTCADPHALAMALMLANEIDGDYECNVNLTHKDYYEYDPEGQVSIWLRLEVQRELERQP